MSLALCTCTYMYNVVLCSIGHFTFYDIMSSYSFTFSLSLPLPFIFLSVPFYFLPPPLQGLMKSGGPASVQASLAKIKTEAERLDVMDKAAGILGELLFTDQLLTQIKEYRLIMLPVSRVINSLVGGCGLGGVCGHIEALRCATVQL